MAVLWMIVQMSTIEYEWSNFVAIVWWDVMLETDVKSPSWMCSPNFFFIVFIEMGFLSLITICVLKKKLFFFWFYRKKFGHSQHLVNFFFYFFNQPKARNMRKNGWNCKSCFGNEKLKKKKECSVISANFTGCTKTQKLL